MATKQTRQWAAEAVAAYRAAQAQSLRAEWTRAAECCDALAQAREDESGAPRRGWLMSRAWRDAVALRRAAAALRAVAAEQPEGGR